MRFSTVFLDKGTYVLVLNADQKRQADLCELYRNQFGLGSTECTNNSLDLWEGMRTKRIQHPLTVDNFYAALVARVKRLSKDLDEVTAFTDNCAKLRADFPQELLVILGNYDVLYRTCARDLGFLQDAQEVAVELNFDFPGGQENGVRLATNVASSARQAIELLRNLWREDTFFAQQLVRASVKIWDSISQAALVRVACESTGIMQTLLPTLERRGLLGRLAERLCDLNFPLDHAVCLYVATAEPADKCWGAVAAVMRQRRAVGFESSRPYFVARYFLANKESDKAGISGYVEKSITISEAQAAVLIHRLAYWRLVEPVTVRLFTRAVDYEKATRLEAKSVLFKAHLAPADAAQLYWRQLSAAMANMVLGQETHLHAAGGSARRSGYTRGLGGDFGALLVGYDPCDLDVLRHHLCSAICTTPAKASYPDLQRLFTDANENPLAFRSVFAYMVMHQPFRYWLLINARVLSLHELLIRRKDHFYCKQLEELLVRADEKTKASLTQLIFAGAGLDDAIKLVALDEEIFLPYLDESYLEDQVKVFGYRRFIEEYYRQEGVGRRIVIRFFNNRGHILRLLSEIQLNDAIRLANLDTVFSSYLREETYLVAQVEALGYMPFVRTYYHQEGSGRETVESFFMNDDKVLRLLNEIPVADVSNFLPLLISGFEVLIRAGQKK